SRPSLETVSLLLRIETRSDEQASAVKELAAWDGDLRADSGEAALLNLWCAAIARRALEPKMGEERFSAYHSWRETFEGSVLARGVGPGGPRTEPRCGPDRGERQPGLHALERSTRALPRGRGEAVRLRPAPHRAVLDAPPVLSSYHRNRHAEVERSPQAAEQPLPAGTTTEEEGEGEPPLVRAPDARAHGHRGRRDRLELHARRSGQQHGPDGRARSDRDRVLRRHVLEVISAPMAPNACPAAFTPRSSPVDN